MVNQLEPGVHFYYLFVFGMKIRIQETSSGRCFERVVVSNAQIWPGQ